MTKKERLLNAMHGQPVDRVPVAFYLHFPDQTDNTVTETVNWVKNTGIDMALVATDGFYALMNDEPLITMDQWKRFRPYARDHRYIAQQVDRIRRIVDALQDDAAVYDCAFTPLAFFKHTLGDLVGGGQTLIMEYWNEHRTELLGVLDTLEEMNFILLDEFSKAGLNGIMFSLQNGERWRFSREEYREFIAPYDQRLVRFVNEKFADNIGHLCSWETEDTNASVALDLYQDIDMQTVNWGVFQRGSFSMAEGRKVFPQAKAVMGGFDRTTNGVLFRGDQPAIEQFTHDLIRDTGDVGFIISADCSINKATPDEHIRWVVEACESYAAQK